MGRTREDVDALIESVRIWIENVTRPVWVLRDYLCSIFLIIHFNCHSKRVFFCHPEPEGRRIDISF